jgi:hypothetical protein
MVANVVEDAGKLMVGNVVDDVSKITGEPECLSPESALILDAVVKQAAAQVRASRSGWVAFPLFTLGETPRAR